MHNVKSALSIFLFATLGLACGDSGLKAQNPGTGGHSGSVDAGGAPGSDGSSSGEKTGSGGNVSFGGQSGTSMGATGGVSTGGTAAGGASGTVCPAIVCLLPNCLNGTVPNPDNPCGCPVCAVPDAGTGTDAASDAGCAPLPCPFLPACPSGSHFVKPLCGCPICEPLDAGQPDDAGTVADRDAGATGCRSGCGVGMTCAYLIADRCSAVGDCVKRPPALMCNMIMELKGCGCDGTPVEWTGGCRPQLPTGYAPAPIANMGSCP